MAEENGDRIEALFHEAVNLPPEERRELLDSACATDPELRAALDKLLADDARLHSDDGTTFLGSPLVRRASSTTEITAPSEPPRPARLGRYRILRLLGEGGMGAVYEAEQDNPRRTVALKVIRPGLLAPSLLKRFTQEAQILGRLHHPGIAAIYEAGVADDGQPFLALELVRGVALDEYVVSHGLAPAACFELLARVCDSVHHAHEQGVIHRDLKPSNIMVDETGQPKVLDFGVARVLDEELLTRNSRTQTGQLVGTLTYMSPEQVAANPAGLDRRSDVYTLGVILFELLARRLPYPVEHLPLPEMVQVIREREPYRLGSIDPRFRGDCETIVAKALEKDRARRYASAAELAADIRRHLGNEPIRARPTSALYRLEKFVRRNKALVGGVAGVIFALVVGLIGTLIFAIREAEQRGKAEGNARRANDEKQAALYQAYRACLAAASPALQNHDVADAARHLESAPEALRDWEWRHLRSRLDDSASVVSVPGGSFLIASPDQLRIGVMTDAGLRVTDLEGGEHRIVPLGTEHRRHINVTQTRRGLRITAWIGNNTAFDVLDDAGQTLCRVDTPENAIPGATTVVMSPDGTRLACRTDGDYRRVAVFDATSGKQTATCIGHGDNINALAFSPDSAWLVTGSVDRTARLWEAATGELLATCRGHSSTVESVSLSPDGMRLVTASADGTVRQWDAQTGEAVELPYERHAARLLSAVYSPDGQCVVSTGEDRTIRVWQAKGRQDVAVLHGHTGTVIDVAFSPDGSRLASRSACEKGVTAWDDTVRVWDVDLRAPLPTLRGHTGTIYPLVYSPDGRWLATGSWDETVRLWDAATGELCATLPHPAFVWGLAFGPDSAWVVTGCAYKDDRLRIWDVATAQVRKEIPFHVKDFHFHSLAVSPDGTRVAGTVEDGKFRNHRLTVFNTATGESLFSTEGRALAYSPDGHWLAVRAADEKTVLLLDARTHETVARFSGHKNEIFKAAFSSDSRRLATGSRDHTVRVWQIAPLPTATGKEKGGAVKECQVLRGHTDDVYAVAFHPDGKRLASAARDGAVWLWDLARGEEVVRLSGHKSFVWSLAFSKDGATLASAAGDRTIRLWDTAPLKTRYQARREAAALRPEAERLVEHLWQQKHDPAEVVKAIRTDRVLNEVLRHAALRAVLHKVQPPEATPSNPPAAGDADDASLSR